MSTKPKLTQRQRWMSDFEDRCIESGVLYETIHGANHADFWASAEFYYTQRLSVYTAVERYVKVKLQTAPSELDSILAEHQAKRLAMLAEPKNPQ